MLSSVDPPSGSGRVSVVIPCHNAAQYVRESVETALRQTVSPLEVLVIDDASTDGSANLVRSVLRARVISLAHGGVSNARNHGLSSSSGEFVLFHDADDRLLPDAIEAGLRAFELHPECGFVYGFAKQIDGTGEPIPTTEPQWIAASYETLLAGSPPVPPSTVLFRRAAVEAVDGFRSAREPVEDVDLYLRVGRSFPIYCHGETVTEYRRHGENVSAVSPFRTLRAALTTLELQRPEIGGQQDELAALEQGRRYFINLFGRSVAFEMFDALHARNARKTLAIAPFALRHAPRGVLAAAGHYVRRLSSRLRPGSSRSTNDGSAEAGT